MPYGFMHMMIHHVMLPSTRPAKHRFTNTDTRAHTHEGLSINLYFYEIRILHFHIL